MKYLVGLLLLLALPQSTSALEPGNLLLITNKNVPEGRKLAEYYTAKRHVPADRILELDLPTTEEISADLYDSHVVPVVRDFLVKHQLLDQVTCLVTFYGVPLKIAAREARPGQQAEDAAFDSELALVRWKDYPRQGWINNPMSFRVAGEKLPPILMSMRLDGPQSGTVRDIIIASLKAEAEGLKGKVVIDAGGHLGLDPKNPGYAGFDRTLRNLAEIVQWKTALPLVLDTQQAVLPAHSVQDAAIYCGWYSLQKYVPACTFVPGAVGYHVASFEMTTLRTESNQWVRGLLNDGVAATLGAVTEPYLNTFPKPDEFFPLLFTGKLTLAEVYWRTAPTTSWRLAMIGDPLYNPFKAHPALPVEALPHGLEKALAPSVR